MKGGAFFLVLAFWLANVAFLPAHADQLLQVSAQSNAVDLASVADSITADRPDITVTPAHESEPRPLSGSGPGPSYFWSVYTLQNPGEEALDFILAFEPQRFAGSGLMGTTPPGPQVLQAVLTKDGTSQPLVDLNGVQTTALRIEPQETVTLAVQQKTAKLEAKLYRPHAFQDFQAGLAFVNGALEATMILALGALAILFFVAPTRITGSGLTMAGAIWIFCEAATWIFASRIGVVELWPRAAGAATESLLLVAISSFVLGVLDPPVSGRQTVVWAIVFPLLGLASIALPLVWAGVSFPLGRVGFPLVLTFGAIELLRQQWQAPHTSRPELGFWFALCLWGVVCGLICWRTGDAAVLNSALALACACLLLVLTVTVFRMTLRDALSPRRVPSLRTQIERAADRELGIADEVPPQAPATMTWQTVRKLAKGELIFDPVTGLATRQKFMEKLGQVLAQSNGISWRVIVADIDRFKLLNEGLGAEIGDAILKTSASRLKGMIHPDEIAARFGGGQFALLCIDEGTDASFMDFADDLQATLAKPIAVAGQSTVISVSIGVSSPAAPGNLPQKVVEQALMALGTAQGAGGACAHVHHPEMRDERARLLALESELRGALARNEISVFYQPIVYLGTLELVGFEALARWHHPVMGLLPPAEFVEIAENTGLMPHIGEYILAQAARQLGIWQRVHRQGQPFFVSVNVSPKQLERPEFKMRLQQVIDRESLVPGTLKLEITEGAVLPDAVRMSGLLREFRALGVGLACDDFGTGYSSLASLRDFPFDTLKMDKSFMPPDGEIDERNAKVITTITALASSLDMVVVAEGIETQAQINKLAMLGVGFGQGYFIAEPETAAQAGIRLGELRIPEHSYFTPAVAKTAPTLQPSPPPAPKFFPREGLVVKSDRPPVLRAPPPPVKPVSPPPAAGVPKTTVPPPAKSISVPPAPPALPKAPAPMAPVAAAAEPRAPVAADDQPAKPKGRKAAKKKRK